MKPLDYRLKVLKKVLLQAYLEKEKTETGDHWQANVMRHVRKLSPLQIKPDPLMQFGQLVWRMTPVSTLLVILSAALLLEFDFTPGYSVLVSLITDVEEIGLFQFLPF
ncbi:MAG: hypothetical protein Q8P24_08510 [Desulfobacterales bacterium]|nr:hypothetical protein [Desulfobacterales bacterium]